MIPRALSLRGKGRVMLLCAWSFFPSVESLLYRKIFAFATRTSSSSRTFPTWIPPAVVARNEPLALERM